MVVEGWPGALDPYLSLKAMDVAPGPVVALAGRQVLPGCVGKQGVDEVEAGTPTRRFDSFQERAESGRPVGSAEVERSAL